MKTLIKTQIFYEIAMSIGNSLDLGRMLREGLSSYLRKLNCSAGIVFEMRKEPGGALSFTPIFSIPGNFSACQAALEHIPNDLTEVRLQGFLETLPISGQDDEGRFFHLMDLSGFGLLLVRSGKEFSPLTIRSLDPLNRKLADSCLACLQNMKIESINQQLTREIFERRQAEAELRKVLDELERLVEERTCKLEESNKTLITVNEQLNDIITERKRAEDELFNSRQMLQSVLDNIPQRVFWKNRDSIVIGCNKAFAMERGREDPSELIDKSTYEINSLSAENTERYLAVDREVMATGRAKLNYEAPLIKPDGSEGWILLNKAPMFDRDGQVIGVLGTYEDITERKRAEEERMRLATAIEQAAEAIITTDANFIINYVNPAFTAMTSYECKEVIGRHLGLLKSDKHDRSFYSDIRETLMAGHVWSGRLTNRKKDGVLYEAEATCSPIRNESGDIINYVSIYRDITLQMKLEKELQHARKMEAIGTLAGGIAHDFNNILAAIAGHTELACFKAANDDSVRRNLDQVLKASARARDLVRQILTFSRHSEPKRQPVSIVSIVEETLMLLRPSLPTTIEIRKEIALSPDDGVVFADPTQIHQVLMNLCTNAAHAMQARGGLLRVKLSDTVIDDFPDSLHPGLEPGPYVCLTVDDTGDGIDAALIERIFDPYFTTKNVGEGTGLGLSVVQGIVRTYGGTITVHSEPGKGATFRVLFPGIEKQTTAQAECIEDLPTGVERILFVDDEDILADFALEMLKSFGYSVVAKTNSFEALESFRADPNGFDLVITDMTMPGLRGDELAGELIAIQPDIPIILCTGFSELIDETRAREMGIREFVMKPYSIAKFADIIRKAIKKD
jgi:PAS domain S-box-containing protein